MSPSLGRWSHFPGVSWLAGGAPNRLARTHGLLPSLQCWRGPSVSFCPTPPPVLLGTPDHHALGNITGFCLSRPLCWEPLSKQATLEQGREGWLCLSANSLSVGVGGWGRGPGLATIPGPTQAGYQVPRPHCVSPQRGGVPRVAQSDLLCCWVGASADVSGVALRDTWHAVAEDRQATLTRRPWRWSPSRITCLFKRWAQAPPETWPVEGSQPQADRLGTHTQEHPLASSFHLAPRERSPPPPLSFSQDSARDL